jgi:tetratricopeptide (TPR) repeat protein
MKNTYWILCLFFLASPVRADDVATSVQACNQARAAGDFAQAVAIADKVLKQGGEVRDAWLCLGRAQSALGNHAAALTALEEAEKLSTQPLQRIVTLTLLGDQHAATNSHAKAREYYEKSLTLAREENNVRFQLININQGGLSLAKEGNHAGALVQYQQGLKLAANDNERADSFERIAATHGALGQYDQAIEYQIKAVLLQERVGNLNQYANANIELGRICLAAKAYKDAENWLSKFIPVMSLNENPYWEARARYLMGKTQAALGNSQASASEFAQSRALAEKIGDRDFLLQLDQEASTPSPM